MSARGKILDYEAALERVENDVELYAELVRTLLEEYGRESTNLSAAIHGSDAFGVESIGHSLKSAFGNVGALAAQEVARDIELAGRAGDFSRAGALTVELGQQVSRFSSEFERMTDGKARSV